MTLCRRLTSHSFFLHGLAPPWEQPLFKATMGGIKRDIGGKVKKKPPVEAWHIAELLSWDTRPANWTPQMWWQGKAMLLCGFQLFNRRHDFPRFQPCDLRFDAEGMRVLIRYAKNDLRGRTREPALAAVPDEPRSCPRAVMQEHMRVCSIECSPLCNKVWGEPYACDHCPPLLPTIVKAGIRERAMPNSRVTVVIKGVFLELARRCPDRLSAQEAKGFSAKRLRTGGVSESCAHEVWEGVVQGHGGWGARKSLDSYGQMKAGEERQVSTTLNEAIRRCGPEGEARAEAARVRGEQAHQADVQSGRVRRGKPMVQDVAVDPGGAPDSSDEDDPDTEFKVLCLEGNEQRQGQLHYKVRWAYDYEEMTTWEPAAAMQRDVAPMVRQYEQQRAKAAGEAQRLQDRAARAARRGQ